MRINWYRSQGKYEVIILSIVAGLSAYIIDAAIDSIIFYEGSFLDMLIFAVPMAEVYFRSYILASFIIFGIFISRILAKRKRAEKALRESEERLRAQYKGIPIPTYTWQRIGKDFVLVDYNDAATTITHGNVANFVGKKASEMYKDRPEIQEELSRCFVEKTPIKREMPYRFSTGEIKHLAVSYSFVPPDRVLVHTEDITERKKADEALWESERRYRRLVEAAPEVIYTLSAEDGRITSLNPAFEKLTGWSRNEWLGKHFASIIHPDDLPLAIETFQKILHGETLSPYELRVLSKSGEYLVGEFTSIPLIENGKVVGEFGIIRDITERKKAGEVLKKEEERFQDVVANTGDWIWEVDADGKYTYASPIVEQVLGYKPEEVLGRYFYDFFLPEEREQLKEAAFKVFARRERFTSFINRNIHKSGRTVILETNGVPILSVDGQLLGYRGADRDVTERKMLEERLSALNFYSGKLNTANNLQQIYELTLDAMEKTLGFEYATFMVVEKGKLKIACQLGFPKPILLELPLDGTKKGITVRAANTRKPILVSDVRKDRDYVEGVSGIRSELAAPVVAEDKVLGILDVESRKSGAFDEKDVTLLQILASHAATAISNLARRQVIEKRSGQMASLMKSSAEMIHSMDLRQRLQTTAEAIGELGWRRVVISARDENLDIANPEDIVTVGLTDEEREFLWINRRSGHVWRERFGPEYERFKIGEFYHLPWSDPWVRKRFSKGTIPSKLTPEQMVDWDPQDLLYAPLRLADGRIVGVVSIDDPLDGKRPTKESLAPLELFLHQAAVAIENAKLIQQLNEAKKQIEEHADQLELKVKQRTQELMEAQNRLLKSERLAAIGEIAAMVGHDLRNPLTGIAGATYYLKMKTGPKMNKKTREMLKLIEEDIEYSNKIINDLLEYSREMQLELTEITPKKIMKEALSLVEVPKNIQVSDSTRTKPKIKVDMEKMKRVFVNIIKNAIDAMPKGGKLTIKSKKTRGNLEIAFTDTGTGMPKDTVEKLWTPLFTTKAKGMGLGLAICKRVIEAHGGSISAESTIGKGTTFTVMIPIQPRLEEGGEKIWVNMPESLLSTTTKA